jgi:hypothetical protein
MRPRSEHIAEVGGEFGCKCPACLASETTTRATEISYRTVPGRGHVVFHLALHVSLPLFGIILIGRSWWALAPVLGFMIAYLANSFILCPSCPYHHAGIRFCGCYPKSVFSYRLYLGRRWGHRENIVGRSLVIGMTIGPSVLILGTRGDTLAVLLLLVSAIMVIFLTSVVSCPDCRQRDVCYLGMLTFAGIKRKDI